MGYSLKVNYGQGHATNRLGVPVKHSWLAQVPLHMLWFASFIPFCTFCWLQLRANGTCRYKLWVPGWNLLASSLSCFLEFGETGLESLIVRVFGSLALQTSPEGYTFLNRVALYK